jgi:hypothetical protein
MEADHACPSTSRRAVDHPIKIDEKDGFARAIGVADTGTHAAGDERQVRVRVSGLDFALLGIQIVTTLKLVVLVSGAFREQGAAVSSGSDRENPRWYATTSTGSEGRPRMLHVPPQNGFAIRPCRIELSEEAQAKRRAVLTSSI